MANINGLVNINAVTYAAGETLNVNTIGGWSFSRLTIDAQNPADVAKVEGTLIGTVQLGFAAEFYVVNTSTTTPLIIKLNSQNNDFLTGAAFRSKFKTRGAMISIGTGTGAIGQTVSTVVGGKSIDWPPFVEVETAAGSGEYIIYLNIVGNYMDDASVVPIGKRTFAEVGTTEVLGAFFEYDELNRTIHFATAAGGYAPPAGANIRIPNIHFTASGTPVLAAASRCLLTNQSAGVLDFECCMFSNRWAGAYTQLVSLRLVDANLPGMNCSQVMKSVYIVRGCGMYDAYSSAVGSGGFALATPRSGHYIRHFKNICVQTNAGVACGAEADIDGIFAYSFARNASWYSAFNVTGLLQDSSKKRISNIHCIGGKLIISGLNNAVVRNVFHSDTTTGINTTLNSVVGIETGNLLNTTIQTIRKEPGGAACRAMIMTIGSMRGSAIRDFVYDGAGHAQSGPALSGFIERTWLADIDITNTTMVDYSINMYNPNGMSLRDVRALRIGGSTGTVANLTQGMLVRRNSTSGAAYLDATYDHELLNVSVTSTPSVGHLALVYGGPLQKQNVQVVSGTDGVDFLSSPYFTVYSAGVELIFTSSFPALGIADMSACVVPALPAGIFEFKIKKAKPGEEWPVSWVALNTTNLRAEFAALVGYSSTEGLHMQVRFQSTGAVVLTYTSVSGVAIDTGFVVTDVGYVESKLVEGVVDSVVGIIDTRTEKLINYYPHDASGVAVLDTPYEYNDGAVLPFRAVCRKPGYAESIISGGIYQDGVTLPLTVRQAHPATNASVAGIALDGVAKTITVTGTKTFQEVYQQSQWWACQRDNMIHDLPMTSVNGQAFEVPLTWKIDWDMPGDGTLVGGWMLLAAGIHTKRFNGTKIETTNAGFYDFAASTFSGTVEFVNTSGGAVVVDVPAGTSYTNTGPNITVNVAVDQAEASIIGIVPGSRLQIYNVTTATEMVNAVNATSSYTLGYPTGTGYTAGDVVRVRLAWVSGASAKLPVEYFTIATAAGWSVLANQQDDAVYNFNAIAGSTCTEFIADYPNVQIDINDPDGVTTPQRGYAWYIDGQMTADGLRYYHGAITAEDELNYRINVTVADMFIQNISASPVRVINARIYRSDGATVIVAGGGGVQMEYGRTYGLETGVSGLTAPESAKLMSLNTEAVNVANMNGAPVIGDGSVADPWRGFGVVP